WAETRRLGLDSAFNAAAFCSAMRSAASLASRSARRRMVFASPAARASSTLFAASRDDAADPGCALRPNDIVYLRPLREPVWTGPRSGARSPEADPAAKIGVPLLCGFVCFGFFAS